MVSTISSAGWPAASIALRTAAMSEVTPVEVSLWTTHTALILRLAVARAGAPRSRSASTPRRQPGACGSTGSLAVRVQELGDRARAACAIFCHSAAKWPVSYISTASPGLSVLTSAASQAPVPDAG